MSYFYLTDSTGRKVSHLKRVRNYNRVDVSVWFDGDKFFPTKRSANGNNNPFMPIRLTPTHTHASILLLKQGRPI